MHTFVELPHVNARRNAGPFLHRTRQPLHAQAPRINSPAILFRRVHVVSSYGFSLAQPYTIERQPEWILADGRRISFHTLKNLMQQVK
jgi:hypothetical protein